MKEIMARESSTANQGVATFEYNPVLHRQGLLFELSRPLEDLQTMLLKEFSGEVLTVGQNERRKICRSENLLGQ